MSSNSNSENLKINEKKWGKEILKAGWQLFPNIIIEKQRALGLSSLDINILLILMSYWWKADNKPHPSKKTIAEYIGVAPRTIQKRIASLEKGGLIKREYRTKKDNEATDVSSKYNKNKKNEFNLSNKYDLTALINEITPFAIEKNKLRAKRLKEDKERITGKKVKE